MQDKPLDAASKSDDNKVGWEENRPRGWVNDILMAGAAAVILGAIGSATPTRAAVGPTDPDPLPLPDGDGVSLMQRRRRPARQASVGLI